MNISKVTDSLDETRAFGERLGGQFRAGDIIALTGELGSGKTSLTQGIGWGLGIPRGVYVNSPSFVLIREYREGRLPLYHMDLFRLEGEEALLQLGYEEYLYGDGVTVIEWAERLGRLFPGECPRIQLEQVPADMNRRRLSLNCESFRALDIE